MRILYLADRLSWRGGADHHLLQVMRWAVEEGHEVGLLIGRADGDAVPPEGVAVTRVRGLGIPTASRSRLEGLDSLLVAAEVVHVQNVMNPVVIERAAATGRAVFTVQDHRVFCPGMGRTLPDGSPCVASFDRADCGRCLPDRSYREKTVALTRRRRDALRGARLVVLSSYMAEELALAGLAGAEVIPPWVEIGPAKKAPGNSFFLGGRLVAHKGIAGAVAAWRRAGRPLTLRVGGEGPLEGQLDDAICLGWLSSADLRLELNRARALLFPSFWQEPFGIIAVEALAAGTPVIAMETGGMNEWNGEGCLNVESGDEAAMAQAIADVASDSQMALRLGREGRASVAENFSRPRISGRLAALYAETISA